MSTYSEQESLGGDRRRRDDAVRRATAPTSGERLPLTPTAKTSQDRSGEAESTRTHVQQTRSAV